MEIIKPHIMPHARHEAYLTQRMGAIEAAAAHEAPVVEGAGSDVLIEALLIGKPSPTASAIQVFIVLGLFLFG